MSISKAFLLAFALITATLGSYAVLTAAPAATPVKHRVVVEVTTEGGEQWTAVLINVENLRKSFGEANVEIEVVGHNKGLGLLMGTNADLQERMKKLAEGGVIFATCENSMRKKNVKKEDLMPFVTTVDSGVAEVVRRQEAGWSYLKTGM